VFGEHLKSLELSVLTLLHRLPHEVGLLESPCYRCGKYLSDIDGLPLNASGWIPPSPARSSEKVNGKADEMDVDGEEKKEDEAKKDGKAEDKEPKDGEKGGEAKEKTEEPKEEDKEGRWVKWHASCRTP
jgi:hypothetical protein